MKILVCVKQVPDGTVNHHINSTGSWIEENDSIAWRMNSYDEYAIEEALKIKEEYPQFRVDVVSLGPDRVRDVLVRAIGMGADKAVHIRTPRGCYSDPAEVASSIADFAGPEEYDLIFTGVMAEDDMHCQTGPIIASILQMPYAVAVLQEELNYNERKINLKIEMEGGVVVSSQLLLPALLTVQSGINRPRYPSLSNVLRAKKAVIPVVEKDLAVTEQALHCLSFPEKSGRGIVIEGSSREKADKLMDIAEGRSLLR